MARAKSLASQMSRFLDHLTVDRGLSANTVDAYRRDLEKYRGFLTRHGVGDATRSDEELIAAFVRELSSEEFEEGRHYRASSVARALAAVRSFHRFLLREGEADSDPAAGIERPKVPRNLPQPLSVDQVQRM